MFKPLHLLFLILVLLVSCTDVQMIEPGARKDLYTKEFLFSIEKVKEAFARGDGEQALFILERIEDGSLNNSERALKYNLRGVIDFSQGSYEQAIEFFKRGLETSSLDKSLTAQLNLNLSSAFYKLDDIVKAYAVIKVTNDNFLTDGEKIKFYRLLFVLADKVGDSQEALDGLTNFYGNLERVGQIKKSEYYGSLVRLFESLGQNQKIRYLEKFKNTQSLAAGYLGYIEVEKLIYNGNKKYAKDLMTWIRDNYNSRLEILTLLDTFEDRMQTIAKIDTSKIGVILPFSGNRRNFSARAMLGLDYAFRRYKQQFEGTQVIVKDSESNGAVGAFRVRQLIEKDSVSLIIGGLFSDEAKEEYLEARKYGVIYVSLSPIYLPKKDKSHLLIEIPGSIESEVEAMFQPKVLSNFGNRLAVIYPNSERGKAYIDEVWNQAKIKNVDISVVHKYEKGLTDYRETVSKILDLKFKRHRQEELDFLDEIYSLKGKTSVRRVQTLPPNQDFDWVFVPSYPNEAVQIVPSFAYYDAFRLNFVGTASWRSTLTQKISDSSAKLYFMGDNSDFISNEIVENFVRNYKKRPGIVEFVTLEAMHVVSALVGKSYDNRDQFNNLLQVNDIINGITGSFELKNNIWIKSLEPLRVRSNGIRKANLEVVTDSEAYEPVSKEDKG